MWRATGINFAAYEALRGIITPPGKSSVARKLSCGALAGSISQTLTYPFDVLRRKMQVTGMNALGVKYNGALDALFSIIRTEGVGGLYRGLWPNLRKSRVHEYICEWWLMTHESSSESCSKYSHIVLHIRASQRPAWGFVSYGTSGCTFVT
jgi:hypothetical protein